MDVATKTPTLVAEDKSMETMPGYLLLARLEKKVLRPGGIELTRKMLAALDITEADHVIEYAPGTGVTAGLTLEKNPASYTAIEKDPGLAKLLEERLLTAPRRRCIVADASKPIDLPDQCATVIYGESMMTIHSPERKESMIREVHRMLRPDGLYAMQEISLFPSEIDADLAKAMLRDIKQAVRHPAWPNTVGQWRTFLDQNGFEVIEEFQRPVLLLEPERLLEDEGAENALRFSWNVIDSEIALKRIREIRSVFQRYRENLCGYCVVCRKKNDSKHGEKI